MIGEICQRRQKHLLDSCLLHLPLPPNFPLFLISLSGWCGCMMKREIPNKSDLHSATVMICVDWPHSARCKKNLQLFTRSRKQELVWIERSSSSPPGGRSSPEIRFAGTSSSSSFHARTRPGGAEEQATSRRAHTKPPQGNWCTTSIWETNYQGKGKGRYRHLGE